MNIKELLILCKRHFGNGGFPVARRKPDWKVETGDSKPLLFVPGLAVVGGEPDFAGGRGDPAVLCVGEFHADDVASEGSGHFRGQDSGPMGSGVERMIEHRT